MTLAGLLLVGAGGALGAMARYAIGSWLGASATGWPLGTMVANLGGCLLLGAGLHWLGAAASANDVLANEQYRLLFAVGFCGSFTTLSALVYDAHGMAGSQPGLALAYVGASVFGGFAAYFAGAWCMARVVNG